jgi:hypothetical protein
MSTYKFIRSITFFISWKVNFLYGKGYSKFESEFDESKEKFNETFEIIQESAIIIANFNFVFVCVRSHIERRYFREYFLYAHKHKHRDTETHACMREKCF